MQFLPSSDMLIFVRSVLLNHPEGILIPFDPPDQFVVVLCCGILDPGARLENCLLSPQPRDVAKDRADNPVDPARLAWLPPALVERDLKILEVGHLVRHRRDQKPNELACIARELDL